MLKGIGRSPDTTIKKINLKHALDLDRRGLLHRQYDLPPVKDTIAVPNNGYVVFRFRADNPGWVHVTASLTWWALIEFDINHSFISLSLQGLAVPLSLPLPRDHRHELNLARRNASWFTARAAQLPDMRRSLVSFKLKKEIWHFCEILRRLRASNFFFFFKLFNPLSFHLSNRPEVMPPVLQT